MTHDYSDALCPTATSWIFSVLGRSLGPAWYLSSNELAFSHKLLYTAGGSSIYTVYFRNGKDASCSMNSCSSCILLTNVHTTHQANTQCHYSLAPLAHTHCQSPNRVQPCLVILSEVDSMKKQHTQSLSSMDTGYLVEAAGSRDSSWWSMAHSCYFVHKKSLETATWLPSLPINNDLLCKF